MDSELHPGEKTAETRTLPTAPDETRTNNFLFLQHSKKLHLDELKVTRTKNDRAYKDLKICQWSNIFVPKIREKTSYCSNKIK